VVPILDSPAANTIGLVSTKAAPVENTNAEPISLPLLRWSRPMLCTYAAGASNITVVRSVRSGSPRIVNLTSCVPLGRSSTHGVMQSRRNSSTLSLYVIVISKPPTNSGNAPATRPVPTNRSTFATPSGTSR
jgi:hypothetical protein